MTYKDDMADLKVRKKQIQAKYGRQALTRLERLSRRDGVDYIDMPEKDFKQAAEKPVASQQAVHYQDGRLKTRLDALSDLAGVDFAGISLDDFNSLLDKGLRQTLTDWKNRHKAASENSNKNANPFA